ncbi:MAG TPA: DUF962 domain-containing protein [Stenomitos sp.]
MDRPFADFEAFWPFYVAQHRDPVCRRLHMIGTTLAIACGLMALRSPWWLLVAPLAGYGFAWYGHFVCEKNRPATFGHVWWSLRADFRMYRYMWLGRMPAELERSRGCYPETSAG